MVHVSSLPTVGTHHRKPATHASTGRMSVGPSAGPATPLTGVAGQHINATTTPRSISRATRNPPHCRVAPSAQSGPPSSVEPTVRPGLTGLVAVKRGREPAPGPGNNPETGCLSDECSHLLTRRQR